MAENSNIEWTDNTFNPWRGCRKVSPACKFCYAETRGNRFGEDFAKQRIVLSEAGWKLPIKWNREAMASGVRRKVFCASLGDVFEDWDGPIVDHNGNELAVCRNGHLVPFKKDDYCDKCDDNLRMAEMNDVRRRLFELIDATPNLDWLLLTKRPENVIRMWPRLSSKPDLDEVRIPVPGFPRYQVSTTQIRNIISGKQWKEQPKSYRSNCWIGTTVENQEQAEKRIPELLKCRDLSPCLFLSCEPLLGPVDVSRFMPSPDGFVCPDLKQGPIHILDGGPQIDWVIAGGESGSNARPSNPDWFRSLRDQCDAAGVPFHFKQWGEWLHMSQFSTGEHDLRGVKTTGPPHSFNARVGKKKAGRLLDGVEHNGVPLGELWITKNV